MKKNIVITVLAILVLGLGGYLVYDKVLSSDNNEVIENEQQDNDENKQNEKKYNVNDYISVADVDLGTYGVVKKIQFKTLNEGLTTDFYLKHLKFISPTASENAKLTNEVVYEVYKNIFSIYTKEVKSYQIAEYDNYYSLNIDLNNNKIVTNQELLELSEIKSTDLFEKILIDISNTVTTEQFLLSITGDVTAETITIDNFKENIKNYVKTIDNRYDLITIYIKDNKLIGVYNQSKILSALGMGTHMGIGLLSSPQTIEFDLINKN